MGDPAQGTVLMGMAGQLAKKHQALARSLGSVPQSTIQTSQPCVFPIPTLLIRKDLLQLEFLAPCVFR